uniref:Ribosome biogenesis protein NOP53 n=1 Tax=Calcidiscus leptoporus TaxID=127549 RepID=A0A6U5D2K6_9EUKA|mmetsp:Transcript_1133/g.2584  ORF Transcript_1133/g.2584 Transcript_1133/m.2584 type:complete len:127 (+) Transcript_1133:60-440(+)
MAKKHLRVNKGKHEMDLFLEQQADAKREGRRLKGQRRAERRKVEQLKAKEVAPVTADIAEHAADSPVSMELELVGQRRMTGQHKRSRAKVLDRVAKRRVIRKTVRKPNKIMKKQLRRTAKRKKMEM